MKMNKSLKLILLICIAIAGDYFTSAQEPNSSAISGRVTTLEGESLPGVIISIEGTNIGVTTDIKGIYNINVPEGKEFLIFSFIGYVTERMAIKSQTTIDVVLLPDLVALSEIVVVGYGVQKKSLVTGSISKISADEIGQTQDLRVEQALQGKVSGVSVQANSGQPGQNLNVLIRGIGSNGNTEPLYIIDGLKVGVDGMNTLNPGNIESIEILKDAASAAIYGTQAANGVILITTKKGKKGEKGTLTYDGYRGISDAAVYPDLMNAREYATYMREAYALEEIGLSNRNMNDQDVQTIVDSKFPYNPDSLGEGTNWVKEIINPASQQSHVLSFSTGTEKSTTYISGSYFEQNGIIGGDRSKFERYTFSINNYSQINDWISVQGKLDYANKLQKTIPENDEFEGIMSMAVNMDPITNVYFKDSSELRPIELTNSSSLMQGPDGRYYAISRLASGDVCNPLALMQTRNNYRKTGSVRGRLSADLEIFKNLVYTPAINFEVFDGLYSQWRPEFYLNAVRTSTRSEVVKNMERGSTYIWEHTLHYDKVFGDHSVGLLIGNSYEKYNWYGIYAQNFNIRYLNDDFAFLASAADAGDKPSDGTYDNVLISYFGRVNYNWKEKVLFTFNYRADGSMKFGTDNRFGYFPSVSLGYVPSREKWWSVPAVNFLKIRGSWGRNGSNANLGSYDYVSIIDFGYYAGRYPTTDDVVLNGAKPSRVENSKLKWETSEQIDIGLDMGLFSNKLFVTADYYIKDQKDFLAEATVPYYVGNPSPIINAGTIRNSGIELDLKYLNTSGELKYSIGASASYLMNKVLEMPDDVIPYEGVTIGSGASSGIVNRFEVGQPVWYFWGYETDGFFENSDAILHYTGANDSLLQPDAIPGDVKFVDTNNDGVIDQNDKVNLGKPLPTWTYGFTMNLSYKIFDFSAVLSAATGNSVYNASIRPGQGRNNRTMNFYDNRWLPDNTDAAWFRPTVIDDNKNFRESDLFVENGSYLKLRNLQIGITIPSKITRYLRIEKLRIYASASNLLTLTNYSGGDPEIGRTPGLQNGSGDAWKSIGIDRGFYSTAKTYIGGISVTF
jgi:TonB-dependent starch-binding outer membrane protein SusC